MNSQSHPTALQSSCTRREFLRGAGGGLASLVLATALATQVRSASAAEQEGTTVGILVDLTRCGGCNACALACKEANLRPHPEVVPIRLDTDAYSFVDTRRGGAEEETAETYVKRQCMHCLHPACVSACTVGALRNSAAGPVVYDADKCIGCRYCQYACPFGVPTYEWEGALGLIHKCQMCADQQAAGGIPACVGACPNGALRFGHRADLLAQAQAQMRSNPGRYVEHIYGENEVGGTSVLYLSSIPFVELGFPVLGTEPAPRYAEAVMTRTPLIALTVAVVATALHRLLRQHGDGPVSMNGEAAGLSAADEGRN